MNIQYLTIFEILKFLEQIYRYIRMYEEILTLTILVDFVKGNAPLGSLGNSGTNIDISGENFCHIYSTIK